jgi:hypothetical protein
LIVAENSKIGVRLILRAKGQREEYQEKRKNPAVIQLTPNIQKGMSDSALMPSSD